MSIGPSITIGMPIFEEERFLAEAIQSVQAQTRTDWQMIIYDNCSRDSTLDRANEIAALDARITVKRQAHQVPAQHNFRSCVLAATTPYFVWLGGHDYMHPDYLQTAIDALDKMPNAVMAYGRTDLVDIERNFIRKNFDEIDTTGLPTEERTKIVLRRTHKTTALWGVYRTNVLKKLNYELVIGYDNVLLFQAALFGDFFELPIAGNCRREIRTESYRERMRRYITHAHVFNSSRIVTPYIKMGIAMSRALNQSTLPLAKKMLIRWQIIKMISLKSVGAITKLKREFFAT